MSNSINRTQVVRAGLVAAAAAGAVNVSLFAGARVAGADLAVVSSSGTQPLSAGHVLIASVVPIVIGTAAAVAAGSPRRIRAIRVMAAVLTVLSLGGPLSMGVDTLTKLALTTMHLVVAAAFLASVWVSTRTDMPQAAQTPHTA